MDSLCFLAEPWLMRPLVRDFRFLRPVSAAAELPCWGRSALQVPSRLSVDSDAPAPMLYCCTVPESHSTARCCPSRLMLSSVEAVAGCRRACGAELCSWPYKAQEPGETLTADRHALTCWQTFSSHDLLLAKLVLGPSSVLLGKQAPRPRLAKAYLSTGVELHAVCAFFNAKHSHRALALLHGYH